jgi:hypothetical protein
MKKKTLFVAAAATSSFTAFLIFDSIAATALSDQSGTITNIQNCPDGRPEGKVSGTWNLIAFRYSEDRLKSFSVPKMFYYYYEWILD